MQDRKSKPLWLNHIKIYETNSIHNVTLKNWRIFYFHTQIFSLSLSVSLSYLNEKTIGLDTNI